MIKKRRVTICDVGRFLVPRNLREELGWSLGDAIAMSPPKSGMITLQLNSKDPNSLYSTIDETGRLTLSKEIKESLGWGKGDILHVTPTPDSKAATVTLCKKNESAYVYPGRRFGTLLPGDTM